MTIVCELCNREYKNANSLQVHKYHAHRKEILTGNFECKICNDRFKVEYLLKQHIKSGNHTKIIYKCIECGAEFKAQKYLRRHCLKFNHDVKFKCSCGLKFMTEWAFKHHQKSFSAQCTVYPLQSTENNKEEEETKSKRVTRLSVLEISRTKVKVKKYRQTKLKFSTNNRVKKSKCRVNKKVKCKICHKMCNGARYLTYHMWKTHNIEREFKCTKCDYTANREDQMRIHENRHKTVSIPCPQCGMLFVSLQSINVHKNHAHNVQRNENENVSLKMDENNETSDKNQILVKDSQNKNQSTVTKLRENNKNKSSDQNCNKTDSEIQKSSKSPATNENYSIIPVANTKIAKDTRKWQDYQYGCGHCQIGFDDNASLWQHLLAKHEF